MEIKLASCIREEEGEMKEELMEEGEDEFVSPQQIREDLITLANLPTSRYFVSPQQIREDLITLANLPTSRYFVSPQ